MWFQFRPYVPVAQRKAQAAREVERRKKKGQAISPVVLDGRTIAKTFWGKAWCDNMESYSDYANRLPRGRTYVRNGSVVDLQIHQGKVTALVSGSEIYEVKITIDELATMDWTGLKSRCAGQICSVVELLQGKLSKNVIGIITDKNSGIFPDPSEIKFSCSCPDWADMCKHVAAVMYGIGARLDTQPELFFVLRNVDHMELLAEAVVAPKVGETKKKTLDASDVAGVFGIDLAGDEPKEESAVVETVKPKKTKAAKTVVPKAEVAPAEVAKTEVVPVTNAPKTRRGKAAQKVEESAPAPEPVPKPASKTRRGIKKSKEQ